ncbi:MAG TPA: hypothetical protein VGH89_34800 [Pseudonocardia sp.]
MSDAAPDSTDTVAADRNGRTSRLPEPRRNESRPPERVDQLERLERRVSQLERLAWGDQRSNAESDSDLSVIDPELARLAETAERGQSLTGMLASSEVRAACEQAIAAWEDWHRRHRELLDTALTASRTIAIMTGDRRSRADAVRTFQEARAELTTLSTYRQGYLNAAIHAKRQLDKDREVRDRCQTEIDAGHQAWITLIARLRLRTASALRRGEPLPAWLVVALGSPDDARSSRWQNLASDLFAYRATYAICDRAEPLGPAPSAEDSLRRRRWHATLTRQLQAWQEPAD